LNDTGLEKLYAYTSWLSRLLPSRELPADITITDDMLTLSAFRLEQGDYGSASLKPGEVSELKPITEFGANPYTEEEEKSLSEIIDSFNERHGTNFTREDFLRFERVNREIMDEDMTEMMRNNPADVVYNAFSQEFFKGMVTDVPAGQRDEEHRYDGPGGAGAGNAALLQAGAAAGRGVIQIF
jgi:type I restriction enzyme R subunit